MSSDYRAICLSHDPAIVIEGEEWSGHNDALAAVASRMGALSVHIDCELVVGRYSTPLIELACPPTHHRIGTHTRTEWLDVDWLRLMLASMHEPNTKVLSALGKFRSCWTADRVYRLRRILEDS